MSRVTYMHFHERLKDLIVVVCSYLKSKTLSCLFQDVSLVTILDRNTWLKKKKKQLLGEKTAKSDMKEVLNTREVSVFLCVLFCIPECLYICVYSCGLKEKRGGGLYQKMVWDLPPSIWHKGPTPIMHAGGICGRGRLDTGRLGQVLLMKHMQKVCTETSPVNFSFLFWSIPFTPW